MVKDNTYVNLQAFMVNLLGLTGIELIAYAIIYTFSQDGSSVFSGSRSYLANWCGCSERNIQRVLKSLIDKGYIKQVYHSVDHYQVHYVALIPSDKLSQGLVTKCHKASDKMSQGLVTKCHKASDKMSQAIKENIEDIKDNTKDENIEGIIVCDDTIPRKKFQKPSIEDVKEYVKEQGYRMDPVKFYDHYESNGWLVGRNKMKDWKASVRNWEHRDKTGTFSKAGSPAEVPFMQNDYSNEHLKKKEEDSLKALDDLLKDE